MPISHAIAGCNWWLCKRAALGSPKCMSRVVMTAETWWRAQNVRSRQPLRVQAARVGGVDIPNQKAIEFSLQYIYGIGHTTAKAILADTVSSWSRPPAAQTKIKP